MNRIIRHIKDWIINVIVGEVVIGGHCGICGARVPDCLVPAHWRITVCDKCAEEE